MPQLPNCQVYFNSGTQFGSSTLSTSILSPATCGVGIVSDQYLHSDAMENVLKCTWQGHMGGSQVSPIPPVCRCNPLRVKSAQGTILLTGMRDMNSSNHFKWVTGMCICHMGKQNHTWADDMESVLHLHTCSKRSWALGHCTLGHLCHMHFNALFTSE